MSDEETLNKSTIYYNNLKTANAYNFGTLDIANDLKKYKSFNCIVTSKTNSGKSVLLNDLVYQIKDWFVSIYVFSLTSYLQPDLFEYCPESNVIDHFDENKLEEIWNRQEMMLQKLLSENKSKDKCPRILILYDDLISDPKVKNSPMLKKLFVAGRHCNISQFFLTQSFSSVSPVLRKNCALAIAFYLDSYIDREAYAKSYLSTKNVKLGIMIFDRITKEPYTAICVLNCLVDSNPENYIKTYKASLDVPKFTIGKPVVDIKNKSITLNNYGISPAQPEQFSIKNKNTKSVNKRDPFSPYTYRILDVTGTR